MTLGNCSRCGRVFASVQGSREICPVCVKEEEENYRKVFQFLSEKPSATAQEISDGTGIELKDIFRFVRENRLRLVRTEGLTCESCGAPISQGKICERCRQKLSEDIKKDLDTAKKAHKTEKSRLDPPARDPKFLKDRRSKE